MPWLSLLSYFFGGGLQQARLNVRGFGKNPDGADDPDGRQRNRRVEVVINTCN
jgi:outer membrane protein OmpA-like peptidoglycan-associated protein